MCLLFLSEILASEIHKNMTSGAAVLTYPVNFLIITNLKDFKKFLILDMYFKI